MKFSTKQFSKTLIFVLSFFMLANTAWSGAYFRSDVYVTSTSASGSMLSARYSNDTRQYIGCSITVGSNPSGDYIYCTARNKSGSYFWCHTFGSVAENYKKALRTMNDYSSISLTKDSSGNCSSLSIENTSYYL